MNSIPCSMLAVQALLWRGRPSPHLDKHKHLASESEPPKPALRPAYHLEGAHLEVIHEGAIAHDPIAVRLDDMRIALRRRDAADVYFLREGTPA